ncbi:type II secretion system protein GspC [Gilvimarinus agarilyticus]|uniref:type II secretion system protein GspC n=1 Tax=unclassified Gilvimarinus TaxID=2642066 RepID=UPI001C08E20A|nr:MULTISPECIES: type II secretion system protein GspC [unclassified Gilvimarinus]MBU2886251.1 type II secretion system protein GspC [Gilvimarinus agarilyticus]MDO6570939.1 type II secretion system protein GspC [Gilvimarinus sp. 2_MG-2023]MDO6747774.1 type II secretion system protein GspC [Gilvimarinus sp. 1_MG-2023]
MQNFSLQDTGADNSKRLGKFAGRVGHALGKIPLRRWQALVLLLIVVWLAHSLAQFFWALAPQPEIAPAQVGANTVTAASAGDSKSAVDIIRLRELSVFGSSSGETEGIEEDPALTNEPLEPQIEDQAVDTKLSLVLQGVINSSDSRAARAIIADAKTQQTYGPGDEIKNMRGVKVAKVLDLRVILDNKGQYESLWLYKDQPGGQTVARRYTPPADSPSRSRADEEDSTAEDQSEQVSGPMRRDTPAAKDEDTSVSVDQLGQNLSDVVAFNIHRGSDGQIQGYKVRPGRNPAAFEAVGLENGDIVTAVNGTTLDNPGRIMEIYRNLGQTTSASLEVERNGDIVIIDVELD